MRYTELFELVYGGDRPSQEVVAAMDPTDRAAWRLLRGVFMDRGGFDGWWAGIAPEDQDEIFEDLRAQVLMIRTEAR